MSGEVEDGAKQATDSNAIVVVTVHGTNDAEAAEDGTRWWQRGSAFAQQLVAELKHRGLLSVEIRPLHWSGANSDNDRLDGARRLGAMINELSAGGQRYAIVAHSHGGNVAMEAIAGAARRNGLTGVVTFGTPFFVRRLKLVPRIVAAFQILLGLTMTPILLAYIGLFVSYADKLSASQLATAVLFFGGIAALCVWALVRGVRRLRAQTRALRGMRAAVEPETWLVVHSPRDEAMRLLETAARVRPSYVTHEWGVRAVKRFGPLAGILTVVAGFAYVSSYLMRPILDKIAKRGFDMGLAADFTFLLLVPVVYIAVRAVVSLIAHAGGGWLYAAFANRMISAGIVGAVYGGDADDALVRVERVPPLLGGAQELAIEAAELGGVDDRAIFESAQVVYEEALANERRAGGFGDPDRMWKLLSDALYHNAYMRDPRVIATVAEHVSRCLSRTAA